MNWIRLARVLFVATSVSAIAETPSASSAVLPTVLPVVTCAYDAVRSKPGVLSVDVYSVVIGRHLEKYVIEYRFRHSETILVGRIGIFADGLDGDNTWSDDAPPRQPDNDGLAELEFLGTATIGEMDKKCHLSPVLDDTFTIKGTPDPVWRKIDMAKSTN